MLKEAAAVVDNKLTHSQHDDEATWSTRAWLALASQRISVALHTAVATGMGSLSLRVVGARQLVTRGLAAVNSAASPPRRADVCPRSCLPSVHGHTYSRCRQTSQWLSRA